MGELLIWANRQISLDLTAHCRKGEGQDLEFKRELPQQVSDLAKSMAAFATTNDGRILIGVANDGCLIGLPHAHDAAWREEFERRILGISREVKPPVRPTVQWAVSDRIVVCVVGVAKGVEPIYYAMKRPYIRQGNVSRPAEPGEVEAIFRSRYVGDQDPRPLPSTREISKRMRSVLSLMNAKRSDGITVSDLARAMSLAAPADLDAVFEGRAPASFALIDRFCARFAVNKEWLVGGRATPFKSTIPFESSAEDYFHFIDEAKPEAVYLVRSSSPVGETCIVVEKDELEVWTLPDVWHVSDHVGAGGSRQLLELYNLFKRWSKERASYSVLGRLVDPKVMQGLEHGDVFPGIVRSMRLDHWWDDLTDIEHKWTTRAGLTKSYGPTFVAAQDIIRSMLERDVRHRAAAQ